MRTPPPPGFQQVDLTVTEDRGDWSTHKLLLPSSSVEEFEQYEFDKAMARSEALQAKRRQEEAKASKVEKTASWRQDSLAPDRPKKPSYFKVDPYQELERAQREDGSGRCPDGAHRVYKTDAPARMLVNTLSQTPSQEDHRRTEQIYTTLAQKGPHRPVAGLQTGNEAELAQLVRLAEGHPHFASVIDLVTDRINLAVGTGEPARIPPILLLGEPGIGKTHFARELAKALGAPCSFLSLDGAFANGILLGSDRRWANSTYGRVFEAVCLGDCASPVMVLDEIDKAPTFHSGSPIDSLHSLLEPETAGQVTDASIDFQFDASFVTWIATANREDRIPATLLSRFRVFRISQPTGDEAIQVAGAVLRDLIARSCPAGFCIPNRRLAVELAHLTAREVYQAASNAVAKALCNGRRELLVDNFAPEVLLSYDPEAPARGLLH